ncbi:LysM peptidoglycan-binding domain-containing protein [Gracilibacillus sp. D59]|uniref:LysM peptidoglycan-binding domain-containing protein n=1 Tax=Gracilibacillus sp. D59 TaxID=3457434 RepID=UPI003FCE54DB
MHHDQRDDQAASLRNQVDQQQKKYIKSDSLPPRSEVHKSRKMKSKWKISFPFIRFILVLFIVIILLILTFKLWGEEYLSSAESKESEHPVEQVFITKNSSNIVKEDNNSDITIHEVERMDSLFSISEQYYGNSNFAKQIMEANQIENDTLIVGQEIVIPNIEEN